MAFQRASDTDRSETNRTRIVVYGGSTAFCYNLAMQETWPLRLEHWLKQHRIIAEPEVLKAGDLAWSLGHAYVRAQREIPTIKPRFILLYSGINDKANFDRLKYFQGRDLANELAAGQTGVIDNNLAQANWWFGNSVVFKALNSVVLPQLHIFDFADRELPYDAAILENYKAVLKGFADLATANGATLIFVVHALSAEKSEIAIADQLRQNSDLAKTSYLSQDFARSLGAIVIDAQDMVNAHPAPNSLFDTIAYFSSKGADRLAEFIPKELSRYL